MGEAHVGVKGHFFVAAYSMQGHINPARCLARRLASIGGPTTAVTMAIPACGYRCIFGSDEEADDGAVSYVPFSDGKDDGSWAKDPEERAWMRGECFKNLLAVVDRLAASGRPVTCVVSTLNMPPAIDVARERGIPLAVFWTQPATMLATYYHYFHGFEEAVVSHAADPSYEARLPGGLRPVRIRDMPSFFTDKANLLSQMILRGFRELFQTIDEKRPLLLVNTFGALEETALRAIQPYLDVVAVGPMLPPAPAPHGHGDELESMHLFRLDGKYMEWLDAQAAKSVVYISFGSLATYSGRQAEEILHGLRRGGRPYLWVVRGEGRTEEVDRVLQTAAAGRGAGTGMVVEWCDQLRVLSHASVACFVTHCGWNSTLEAVADGVPAVAVPGWSDQSMNARLMEEEWGVGVRAERDADGVLRGDELARCVELVMAGDDDAAMKQANARLLKAKAQEAMAADGPLRRSVRRYNQDPSA
uniref:Uncharacterized protein n=1 Tax=Avena sativa TaxID=4498 RepID=A0ACD6ABA6_AVESA